MTILGLVIMVAAIAFGVGALQENSTPAHLTILHRAVPSVTTQGHVFLVGALFGTALLAGMALLAFGIRRTIRLRRDVLDLQEERKESMAALVAENRRLQRELTRTHGTADKGPAVPPRPTSGAPVPAFLDSANS